MNYSGFTIVFQVLLLFAFISIVYFIIKKLQPEWSIIIISVYVHCFFMYITFFPIT
jgi:hypothetical protein